MFIILQPHSNTNPTGKYRVVDGEAWTRYVNGAQTSGYTIIGEWVAYESALAQRDELNKDVQR